MATVENCQNCAFGQDSYGHFNGACRRHAPKAVVTQYGFQSMWPPVQSGDFCGDFELKDAADHQ
jgi:hypothetical protein